MSLLKTIAAAQKRLAQASVDNPALDARLLIGHALGLDRASLLTQEQRILTQEERATIKYLISRRAAREPVGRILGQSEFWGLPFGLNEATLEPRPDSETLIEAALAFLEKKKEKWDPCLRRDDRKEKKSLHILDLGTGTGCLLLSLLQELPQATGLGIDISPRAIDQATTNAKQLGLEDRSTFQTGDWLEGVDEKFDLILSNPPYIPSQDIAQLDPEVRLFDPKKALDGGTDGFDPYRTLIPLIPSFLRPKGIVVFEVGIYQAEPVKDIMKRNGFERIESKADLSNIPRCIIGQFLD